MEEHKKIVVMKKYIENSKKKNADKQKYKMVPIDMDTYERLIGLVYVNGFGRRTQGAVIQKLIDSEIEKIMVNDSEEKTKLIEYFKIK